MFFAPLNPSHFSNRLQTGFFSNLEQWGHAILRTALDNALTKNQLRLIWPVTDQLDAALYRFQKAVHDFSPGLHNSHLSLSLAKEEWVQSYNHLQDRLTTLPLVRSDAGKALRQILIKNKTMLQEAGIKCSARGHRCTSSTHNFEQAMAKNGLGHKLWADNGVLIQVQKTLDIMRHAGPSSLVDPLSSIENLPQVWQDLLSLEHDQALVDVLVSTLDTLPQSGLVDEEV